ncbi:MAG: hypothetical protein ACHQ51_09125 [Elusimicrobiota bacterium]
MEALAGLKQMEATLSTTCDKVNTLKAKVEDLLFRAQRISNAQKNGMPNNDTMYGYDLQKFRRDVRSFSNDISGLPVLLGSIATNAVPDDRAAKFASSVMRLASRLSQALRGLHDMSLLAHQHIRAADLKIEAWYLAQEIEELVTRGQGLPTVANKIVMATAPAAAPATAPAAAPPAAPAAVAPAAAAPLAAPAVAPAPAPAAPPAPPPAKP